MALITAPDSLVWNQTQLAAAMANLFQAAAGVAGVLNGALKVDLWTTNITPTPANVLADLTPAVYTGYAAKSITAWGSVRTDASGRVSQDSTTTLEWAGPAAGGGPTVYGYAVENVGGTTLLYSVKFAGPVALTSSSVIVGIVPTFSMPPTSP